MNKPNPSPGYSPGYYNGPKSAVSPAADPDIAALDRLRAEGHGFADLPALADEKAGICPWCAGFTASEGWLARLCHAGHAVAVLACSGVAAGWRRLMDRRAK